MEEALFYKGEKMIRAILFDLDGVILDSMDMWQNLGPNFIKSLGLEAEEDLGKTLYTMTDREGYIYLKENYQLPLSLQEIEERIRGEIQHFYLEAPLLRPGAQELLQDLAGEGISSYLCSQTPRDLIQGALEVLGLDSYFQKIWSTGGRAKGKEDPEIFQEILEDLGLQGPDLFYLEDSLYALRTAETLGIQGIYIQNSWNPDSKEEEGRPSYSLEDPGLRRLIQDGIRGRIPACQDLESLL